jgi:predicted Zn-dependent peptidase
MAIINGGYKEYRLDNGLVVALQKTPSRTLTAMLRMNYGGYHEKEGEEGLAHFLEHCLCMGGTQQHSPAEIDLIQGMFGHSNADTSLERTRFHAASMSSDFKNILDFLVQTVFYPRFDVERVNAEREVVLREISDCKSRADYTINREFGRIFYRNHPINKFLLGKEENIKSLSIDKLKEFYNRGYHPNNADLIIVGDIPEQAIETITEYFGNLIPGQNTKIDFPVLPHLTDKMIVKRHTRENINVDNPSESSADIYLASDAPLKSSPDFYSFAILTNILGGDRNSRLFHAFRTKKGLAYNVKSSYYQDYNAPSFRVNSAVSAQRIDEAIATIFDEILLLKERNIEEEELARIKKLAQFCHASHSETNAGHVAAIADMLDDGRTPDEILARYEGVTVEQVRDVANRYLPDRETGKYLLYILNPVSDK